MGEFISRIYHSKPIYNHKTAWFLLLTCFIFALLRLPSLIEPHWYGDEGIYQVVGRALDSGRMLYKEIWDNKPPLLYLLYALLGGNLFGIKLLSLLFGLFSVISFYFLSTKIFKNQNIRFLSTFIYSVLFGLPVLEGNIANAENFMLLPIIICAYLIFSYSESKKISTLLIAGVLLAFAFATKVVAVFDFAAFLFFLILANHSHGKITISKHLFYFFLSFVSIMTIFACYFIVNGAFQEYLSSVFFQNISYVGEQNRLIFPLGILLIKTVILFILVATLFLNKKRLSKQTIFIYLWTIFSLYNAFFSERAYTHYMLVALPAFALLVGHFFDKARTRVLDGLIIIGISIVAYYYFQIYYKTFSYYQNYIQLITNNKNIVAYESFFDSNTPRDYDIANFITMNVKSDERVFLWSDSAQIYALSHKLPIGKYVVAYHITFYKNADIITKKQIEEMQPKFIIQTVEDPLVNDLLSSYQLKYIMEGAKIYEREI